MKAKKSDKPITSQLIAGALERAAAASPQPIKTHDLIHPEKSLRYGYLGARLCGLAFYWLHKEQGITQVTLANAIRCNVTSVASRLKTAAQLKRVDPWKQVYQAVTKQPISPAVE
jgi:hypothetical protein